ncbi:MAG: leucine-rich repeat domain-containing protein, partial [Solirubrobacterales bacterium]
MKKALVAAVVCLFLLSVANAEEPVHFADAALKGAVEDELWVSDPTPTDMLNLTSLDAGSLEIQSLVGLEYAANLTDLRLRFNRIQDISPLAGLTNLRHLVL